MYELASELYNHVVSSKDWAECVAFGAEEVEAVAMRDVWFIEGRFNTSLC